MGRLGSCFKNLGEQDEPFGQLRSTRGLALCRRDGCEQLKRILDGDSNLDEVCRVIVFQEVTRSRILSLGQTRLQGTFDAKAQLKKA